MPLIALPKVADWSLGSGLETVQGIGIRLSGSIAWDLIEDIFPYDTDTELTTEWLDLDVGTNAISTMSTAQSGYIDGKTVKMDSGNQGATNRSRRSKTTALTPAIPTSYTVKFRVYHSALGIVGNPYIASNDAFDIYIYDGTYILVLSFGTDKIIYTNSAHAVVTLYNASAPIGSWVEYMIVKTGSTGKFYMNGTYIGALTDIDLDATADSILITQFGILTANRITYLDNFKLSSATASYSVLSPVAESPWIAIDQNTFDGTTPISILENKIATVLSLNVGSLTYQYALNNGAYNGSELTHAQLLTALLGATITDHTNSLRIKVKFVSDGAQATDIAIASFAQASGITGGGLLVHPGHRGGYR